LSYPNYEIKFKGLKEFQKTLLTVNKELEAKSTEILMENMTKAVNYSKADAGARGWKLANQIMLISAAPNHVVGGCLAPYAAFPEFGTMKQAAQPFWRPYVWHFYFQALREIRLMLKELYKP
jgi:HK97 gp10 family phage protein